MIGSPKNKNHTEMISLANKEISKTRREVSEDPSRCGFHFMAPAGWMNDPNGLSIFKGEYHLFYQHNPYSSLWGPMHWGHAKSEDLINWQHLSVALAPSEPYERGGGCFSGSAVEWDGKLNLFYTAALFDVENGKIEQTQCRAQSSDGIRFEKDGKNPLIAHPPDDFSPSFRDPKVWLHDEKWYMVIGGSKDNKGQVLLYKSDDMEDWEFCGVLAESDGEMGFMWECPDFFPLQDKYVLLISAILDEYNHNETLYLVGEFDYETLEFNWRKKGFVDFGNEFYAPQTILTKEGDRVMLGWLNTWNNKFGPGKTVFKAEDKKWSGSLSLPRILDLSSSDDLLINPYAAINKLRGKSVISLSSSTMAELKDEVFADWETRFEMNCVVRIENFREIFGITFGAGDTEPAGTLTYDPGSGNFTFERKACQYYDPHISECHIETEDDGLLEMTVYVDGPVIEFYFQRGKACLTAHADPARLSRGISFFGEKEDVKIEVLNIFRL